VIRTVAILSLLVAAGACARPRFAPPAVGASGEPDAAPAATRDAEDLRRRHLRIPVAGVEADQIHDSFADVRENGRQHNAIDILAPRGTPVLAADDGRVLRLSTSDAGGVTIYAVDQAARFVYYYAHLDHYAASVAAGMRVAKGDTIGFVGTTGNAPKNMPHLHFQIMRMPNDGKYWRGEPIDPFPVLGGARR
jgi:murein DD-endopeptidase MepM/ murein hydrolase activator NlpD